MHEYRHDKVNGHGHVHEHTHTHIHTNGHEHTPEHELRHSHRYEHQHDHDHTEQEEKDDIEHEVFRGRKIDELKKKYLNPYSSQDNSTGQREDRNQFQRSTKQAIRTKNAEIQVQPMHVQLQTEPNERYDSLESQQESNISHNPKYRSIDTQADRTNQEFESEHDHPKVSAFLYNDEDKVKSVSISPITSKNERRNDYSEEDRSDLQSQDINPERIDQRASGIDNMKFYDKSPSVDEDISPERSDGFSPGLNQDLSSDISQDISPDVSPERPEDNTPIKNHLKGETFKRDIDKIDQQIEERKQQILDSRRNREESMSPRRVGEANESRQRDPTSKSLFGTTEKTNDKYELVNDSFGSPDPKYAKLAQLSSENERVKSIYRSGNNAHIIRELERQEEQLEKFISPSRYEPVPIDLGGTDMAVTYLSSPNVVSYNYEDAASPPRCKKTRKKLFHSPVHKREMMQDTSKVYN